jgi:hypothetical protein
MVLLLLLILLMEVEVMTMTTAAAMNLLIHLVLPGPVLKDHPVQPVPWWWWQW